MLRQNPHVWLCDYLAVVAGNTIDIDRFRRERSPAQCWICNGGMIHNVLVIFAVGTTSLLRKSVIRSG